MNLTDALQSVLEQRMPRVRVRAGNGLSRNMNSALRSYRHIPLIITRSVECLSTLEYLFGFWGTVRLHPTDLYGVLIRLHEDWYQEVPVLPSTKPTAATDTADSEETARPVAFLLKPRLPLHQFTAAWTIARRVGLVTGHGLIGLHPDVLAELRRQMRATRQEPNSRTRDPPMNGAPSQWHDKV